MPAVGRAAPPVSQVLESESLDFNKRNAAWSRLDWPLTLGSFFGDQMHQSFLTGTGLHFRFTPALSLGADFAYTRLNYDPASSFGQAVTDKNMFLTEGVFRIAWPGLYRDRTRDKEMDFYSLLGGGAAYIGGSWEGTGFVGLGLKIYTRWDWLATRVEIRHHFLSVPTAGGSAFENNLMLLVGPVIQLPPYKN